MDAKVEDPLLYFARYKAYKRRELVAKEVESSSKNGDVAKCSAGTFCRGFFMLVSGREIVWIESRYLVMLT